MIFKIKFLREGGYLQQNNQFKNKKIFTLGNYFLGGSQLQIRYIYYYKKIY